MKKQLLFVTSRLPWPTTSGRKVSLWHYCRGLSERGFEVSLYVFPEWDQPRTAEGKPDFIREVRFAAPVGKGEKLRNLLLRSLFGKNRWPLQCALYYSRKNAAAIAAFAKELAAEVVIFDMIRTAPYMDAITPRTVRKILDLDDLLSLRYSRQLAAGVGDVSVAGRYAGGMSTLADRLLCRGVVGKWVLRFEQKRLQRAEVYYAKKADGVILVSPEETAAFNRVLGEEKTVAVPMGVDVEAFSAALRMHKAHRTFGFVGNLHVAANVASLDRIVQHILPRLEGNFTFEVVGPCPPEVRERYRDVPGVRLLGEVESLVPVVGRWQCMLSPIAFGSGIKTKILEAMAMGLPVVTNAVGAEGILPSPALLVAEEDAAIASEVSYLLFDKARCGVLGDEAHAHVAAHFSWQEIFKEFAKLGL